MQREQSLTDLSRTVVENNRSGKSEADSVTMLQSRGWPKSSAQRFVHETTQAHIDDVVSYGDGDDEAEIFVTSGDASLLTMLLRITALVGVGLMLLHMLSLLFN